MKRRPLHYIHDASLDCRIRRSLHLTKAVPGPFLPGDTISVRGGYIHFQAIIDEHELRMGNHLFVEPGDGLTLVISVRRANWPMNSESHVLFPFITLVLMSHQDIVAEVAL